MKDRRILILVLSLGLSLALLIVWMAQSSGNAAAQAQGPYPSAGLAPNAPLGTAFTYQGHLSASGNPVSGTCDFRFILYDAAVGGAQVGTIQESTGVQVTDGFFSVELDFGGGVFRRQARWLEIAVQCAGDTSYTTLGRQALTATPQALYALDADRLDGQQASAFADASHDHLGETWDGSDNPLVISGTFGAPDYAPLVLNNSHRFGDGLLIDSTSADGAYVRSAGGNGVRVGSADGDGVYVGIADDDGVNVHRAGSPSTTTPSTEHNGFEVAGAEGYGLYVGRADQNGVYVHSAGGHGIVVNSSGGNGVHLMGAADGVSVDSPLFNGMYVTQPGEDGVYVDRAGDDGMYVNRAGSPSDASASTDHNGFEVAGAEGHGLYVGRADQNGVYVHSAGGHGIVVNFSGGSGIVLRGAADGVDVPSPEFNGIYVTQPGEDGVYVEGAGDDGVDVRSADGYGVYASTADADHEWGFYTPDRIYAGTTLASAGPLTFVAQNGDTGELEPGDVVAGIGLAKTFADGPDPVPLVGRADGESGAGVIGVVLSRFVAEAEVEEIETDSGTERHVNFHTHSAEGPVAPGEHMLIVVLGVAQVKVDPAAEVQAGQRLTASDVAGSARGLRTETLNGLVVTEGAPVIGVALASPTAESDTIPVFVTLR